MRRGNSSGRVVGLFLSPRKGEPTQACHEVRALAGQGLDGDVHARPGGSRQVLLLESETLAEFTLAPGALKENITTAGLALATLAPGIRLRVGEALLEIAKECAPCGFVDGVQAGLLERIRGRRGMLARVVEGGAIRLGDAIEVLGAEEP